MDRENRVEKSSSPTGRGAFGYEMMLHPLREEVDGVNQLRGGS